MTDIKPDDESAGNRSSDDEAKRFRSDRIFNIRGEWFFHTREGTDVGPYASRGEAAEEAARLARIHAQAGKSDPNL